MPRKLYNRQMFALSGPPPATVRLAGALYRLVRVFKHDFFAATGLYETAGPAELPRIVVKIGRTQRFCGLGMSWYGRCLRRREEAIYRTLAGVSGVPRWAGGVDETAYAIEYVDATPLDHLDSAPPGFFDRLTQLMEAVHARGVAYCDANKRSNILVDAAGAPWLVDYQIAIQMRGGLPWPLRSILAACVRYMQRADLYHLYKHKRRLAPHELTDRQEHLSRRRGVMHTLHRKLTTPWRAFRRRFLRGLYKAGHLRSPSAELEEHYQPEKGTWRES